VTGQHGSPALALPRGGRMKKSRFCEERSVTAKNDLLGSTKFCLLNPLRSGTSLSPAAIPQATPSEAHAMLVMIIYPQAFGSETSTGTTQCLFQRVQNSLDIPDQTKPISFSSGGAIRCSQQAEGLRPTGEWREVREVLFCTQQAWDLSPPTPSRQPLPNPSRASL